MNLIDLNKFKEEHKSALFPPSYENDEGIYTRFSDDGQKGFNCYAYAMQFIIPVARGNGYYRPGFLSGMAPKGIYTENTIIPAFLGDCKYLGLEVQETTLDSPLIAKAYKIILFHNECSFNTFHFVRQNEDGRWSAVSAWGEWPEVGTRINEEYFEEEGFEKKTYLLSRK